jgi:Zn-dependent peptidase ImmA (M78 family)
MSTVEYEKPSPCEFSREQIYEISEQIARDVAHYKSGEDIVSAVNRLGGEVVYQDFWEMEDTDSGSIQVEPDNSFRIFLPNHTSKQRDRFTIAHELGHFVLHYILPRSREQGQNTAMGDGLKATRFGSGQVEIEANWFAAAFLMPSGEFRAKFEEFGKDLDLTADFFDVSVAAATVRAKSLGLKS